MVPLSILIAIVAAYGGLRVFLARQDGIRLFGARSPSASRCRACTIPRWTASFRAAFGSGADHMPAGWRHRSRSCRWSWRCCLRDRGRFPAVAGAGSAPADGDRGADGRPVRGNGRSRQPMPVGPGGRAAAAADLGPARRPGPAAPRAPAARLPVEGADGTHFIDTADVRSVRADAHYTRVHDGTRERMCPWSISEAEAQLVPGLFVRVHRSHIVAIPHVSFVRKEGDGAVIELEALAAPGAREPRQDRRGQGEARARTAQSSRLRPA